jgi:hypothetical protein
MSCVGYKSNNFKNETLTIEEVAGLQTEDEYKEMINDEVFMRQIKCVLKDENEVFLLMDYITIKEETKILVINKYNQLEALCKCKTRKEFKDYLDLVSI